MAGFSPSCSGRQGWLESRRPVSRAALLGEYGDVEIACRIIRTCRRLGIQTVAVYSEADATAQHVRLADFAYPIGGPRPADSYLRGDAIIDPSLNLKIISPTTVEAMSESKAATVNAQISPPSMLMVPAKAQSVSSSTPDDNK